MILNLDWGQIATVVGAFAAFSTAITVIYKLTICPLKNAFSKVVVTLNTINKIADEFSPNGGSSLKDAIIRIELAIAFSHGAESALATVLGIAMWKTNKDGKLIWASTRLCELFNLSPEDMTGSGWINGVAEENREQVVETWASAVKEKRRYDNTYKLSNGIKVHARCNRVLDGCGEIIGYVGTIKQVNEDGSTTYQNFTNPQS